MPMYDDMSCITLDFYDCIYWWYFLLWYTILLLNMCVIPLYYNTDNLIIIVNLSF